MAATNPSNVPTVVEGTMGGALAVVDAVMFEEDAGAGFENADRDSYAIPFLSILQSGSPQCKKSEGAYIKGAEEGFLFNSVTQQFIDGTEGVIVVPVHYTREFIEWVPRGEKGGGGFAGTHTPDEAAMIPQGKNEKGQPVRNDNGNLLQDTRGHYVLVIAPDGSFTPALVSMSSTQIKKSKNWMSKMDGIKLKNRAGQFYTPPMFSHYYKLTTVPESNDQGSWFGWKVELVGMVADAGQYAAAKALRQAILSGEARAQQPEQEYVSPRDQDDDIPF